MDTVEKIHLYGLYCYWLHEEPSLAKLWYASLGPEQQEQVVLWMQEAIIKLQSPITDVRMAFSQAVEDLCHALAQFTAICPASRVKSVTAREYTNLMHRRVRPLAKLPLLTTP